jgi:NAD(P)-dependent dehydrogenase (short-subunit alcohol dehydrogenase family)
LDLELEDKVVIVTGSGSGIGAATARALVTEGARVLLADRDEQAVTTVAADICRDETADAFALTVDVSRAGDVAGMVEAAVQRWGRLDGAVNNAGLAQPAMPTDPGSAPARRSSSTGATRPGDEPSRR